jgi:hypothetical protein
VSLLDLSYLIQFFISLQVYLQTIYKSKLFLKAFKMRNSASLFAIISFSSISLLFLTLKRCSSRSSPSLAVGGSTITTSSSSSSALQALLVAGTYSIIWSSPTLFFDAVSTVLGGLSECLEDGGRQGLLPGVILGTMRLWRRLHDGMVGLVFFEHTIEIIKGLMV